MEQFLIVISITLLASMSPWPDFILATKNNLLYGLKSWIFTSVGIWLWVLVHVAYCIAGVWFIISQSILLFNAIKILGALYLLYLAYLLLKSKKEEKEITIDDTVKIPKTQFKFLIEWFLGNALNPKATIFFLSMFTQVISIETSFIMQISLWFTMMLVVALWFVLFSFLLNLHFIKKKIGSIHYIVEKCMWWVLAIISVKILLDSNKN